MRAVAQRVKEASVTVDGAELGSIEAGLLVYIGVGRDDGDAAAAVLAEKIVNLRIFRDEEDRMNRSVLETGGSILAISQFTLWGDCRKGRRPSFNDAAPADEARRLYGRFLEELAGYGLPVASGRFQALMEVRSVVDGPVTMLLDTDKRF